MKDNTKIRVTYPDGTGTHETTLKELHEKWKDETLSWQDVFFGNLSLNGVAYSNFGKYEVIKKAESC